MNTRRAVAPYDVTQTNGTILDILSQYATICAKEFCGRCMPCRYGTQEWTFIIQKLIDGNGTLQDLNQLKQINQSMKTASFCRLGQVSPFIIDSILKYHEQALISYITDGTPLVNNIVELPKYFINPDLCKGCDPTEKSFCQISCTANAIVGEKTMLRKIDQGKCFRCDSCISVCPQKAIYFA